MTLLAELAAGAIVTLAAGALYTVGFVAWTRRAYTPDGRFVEVTGGRLHVIDIPGARADAPVVALLHGASGNARDMAMALAPSLRGRYRVLAFDRPGHGWSDRPGGRADAAPARQAALIREALGRLGVQRAIVVGHSWSGALATRLALDCPELVAGLVLVAPVTHPWPGGVSWYYGPAASALTGRVFTGAIAAPVGSALLKPSVASVFHPDAPPPDYAARGATWLVLRPAEFRANAQDVADLLGHVTAQFERYDEIAAPTAIVHGEADTTVSPTLHSRAIARQIAGSRLTLLAGAGHMPHHTHAELVAAEIDAVAAAAFGAGVTAAPGLPAGSPRR
ncbi:alpha/beta hydrolase [Alsobacter sp. SYSU M60028]|uniref:Alpha/beta hydrolase n=1 Tax=Alsobacter ponti TaxID=2962936 RepID=A0ABT1LE47_9HYPH|nr:alpha/beta hydrolase [Alsobacter ponti]MCP8939780.1 alpha/beta hydrolase [Alsobacter ponti]